MAVAHADDDPEAIGLPRALRHTELVRTFGLATSTCAADTLHVSQGLRERAHRHVLRRVLGEADRVAPEAVGGIEPIVGQWEEVCFDLLGGILDEYGLYIRMLLYSLQFNLIYRRHRPRCLQSLAGDLSRAQRNRQEGVQSVVGSSYLAAKPLGITHGPTPRS